MREREGGQKNTWRERETVKGTKNGRWIEGDKE